MHLGPDDVLLNIEVKFTPGLTAEDIHAAVHRIEERITEPYPRGQPHLHRGRGAHRRGREASPAQEHAFGLSRRPAALPARGADRPRLCLSLSPTRRRGRSP